MTTAAPTKTTVIIHVREPRTYDVPQEYAAWHETRTSETGYFEFELVEGRKPCGKPSGEYWYVATLPGTVASAYYASHFGGVAYGEDRGRDMIGKPAEVPVKLRAIDVVAIYGLMDSTMGMAFVEGAIPAKDLETLEASAIARLRHWHDWLSDNWQECLADQDEGQYKSKTTAVGFAGKMIGEAAKLLEEVRKRRDKQQPSA